MEDSLTINDIQELILGENASLIQFEVIAIGMTTGGIGVSRTNFFVANSCNGESP
jgi:hypothetical protein